MAKNEKKKTDDVEEIGAEGAKDDVDSGDAPKALQKLYCFESRARGMRVHIGAGVQFVNHLYNTTDEVIAKRLESIVGVKLISIVMIDETGLPVDRKDASSGVQYPWWVVPVDKGSEYDRPSGTKGFKTRGEALAYRQAGLKDDGSNYDIVYRGE